MEFGISSLFDDSPKVQADSTEHAASFFSQLPAALPSASPLPLASQPEVPKTLSEPTVQERIAPPISSIFEEVSEAPIMEVVLKDVGSFLQEGNMLASSHIETAFRPVEGL